MSGLRELFRQTCRDRCERMCLRTECIERMDTRSLSIRYLPADALLSELFLEFAIFVSFPKGGNDAGD